MAVRTRANIENKRRAKEADKPEDPRDKYRDEARKDLESVIARLDPGSAMRVKLEKQLEMINGR